MQSWVLPFGTFVDPQIPLDGFIGHTSEIKLQHFLLMFSKYSDTSRILNYSPSHEILQERKFSVTSDREAQVRRVLLPSASERNQQPITIPL